VLSRFLQRLGSRLGPRLRSRWRGGRQLHPRALWQRVKQALHRPWLVVWCGLLLGPVAVIGCWAALLAYLPLDEWSVLHPAASFDSIILDMRQDVGAAQVEQALQDAAAEFRITPHLNSQFSLLDRVFVVKGDRSLLQQLRRSPLARFAESIEPNYRYELLQTPAASPDENPLQISPESDPLDAPTPTPSEAPESQRETTPESTPESTPEPASQPSSTPTETPKLEAPTPAPANAAAASFAIPPNDPDYPKQWHLKAIAIEAAWQKTQGKGVIVAVLDTGVSPLPDLPETRLAPGYDFVRVGQIVRDDQGHGSSVAGTIAQATNNQLGGAGVAPAATILPMKVLDKEGKGTAANLAEAVHLAVDRGAQVINLSLGGHGNSRLLRKALAYADEKQVVVVAAVGNQRQGTALFPARYPKVIGVAATAPNLPAEPIVAPYSNYGAGVDLAAPGGATVGSFVAPPGIWQNTLNRARTDSTFAYYGGSSAAAAQVSGVAALLKAQGITAPRQIGAMLQTAASPVPEDAWNQYGAGHLNAAAAVHLPQPNGRWFGGGIWSGGGMEFGGGQLPRALWIDPQVLALRAKLSIVALSLTGLGGVSLIWRVPLKAGGLWLGLLLGGCGLFWLKGLYVDQLPQYPLRLLGSALPDLAGSIQGQLALHPATASVAFPLALALVSYWGRSLRPVALGLSLGVAANLTIQGWLMREGLLPPMSLLGDGGLMFVGANALGSLLLALILAKSLGRRRSGKVSSRKPKPLQKV
jgi:serine protease